MTAINGEEQAPFIAPVQGTRAEPSNWEVAGGMAKITLAGGVALGNLYYTLEEYKSENPNWIVISACQLSGGASIRIIRETIIALFKRDQPYLIEKLDYYKAAFAAPIYLILYNLTINIQSLTTQAILTAVRQIFVGDVLAGDVATLFKQPQEIYNNLEVEKPVVNHLLGPDFNNTRGMLVKYGLLTSAGLAMIIAAKVFDNSPSKVDLLLASLGNFLATQGVSYFLTDKLLEAWKKMENESQGVEFQGIRLIRLAGRVIQRVSAETSCILYLFVKNKWVYLVLGGFYGSIERCKREKFQTHSQVDENQRKQTLYTNRPQGRVLRTAAKIYRGTAVIIPAISIAGLIYGYVTSPPGEDREEVGVMIGSISTTFFLAHAISYLFTPETCGRLLNELYYLLIEEPYLIIFLFRILYQFNGALNNETLNSAVGFDFACGVGTQILYTAAFVLDFVTNGRISMRIGLSTPFFRAAAFQEVLAGLTGRVSLPAQ